MPTGTSYAYPRVMRTGGTGPTIAASIWRKPAARRASGWWVAGEARRVAVTAKEARTVAVDRRAWRRVLTPLLAAAALAALAFGVDAAFADRALPGVTVGGVEIGTLSAAELRDRLVREAGRRGAGSQFTVAGRDGLAWSATNERLAIGPDVDLAVGQALAYGHTGTPAQRLVAWLDALRGRAAVPFAMRVDGSALDEWARTIAGAVDRPAADGAIVPTFHGIEVTPAVVGRAVDAAALRRALLASGTLGDRAIALQVHETYPAVDRSGIRDAAAKAVAATTELAIVAGDRTASEDAAGLATLLVIQKDVAAPDELDAIPAGASAPATRYVYHVRFDEPRV